MFRSNPHRTRALALLMAVLLVSMPVWSYAASSDQWYKDHAKRMLDKTQELLNDTAYMKTYAGLPEAQALAAQWRTALEEAKPVVHLFPAPTLEEALRLTGDSAMLALARGMGDVARERLEGMSVWLLHNHVFSTEQSETGIGLMVAGNALTLSELAQVPEGFENTLLVYEYDTFVLVVSFVDRGPAILISTLVTSPAFLERLQGLQ